MNEAKIANVLHELLWIGQEESSEFSDFIQASSSHEEKNSFTLKIDGKLYKVTVDNLPSVD